MRKKIAKIVKFKRKTKLPTNPAKKPGIKKKVSKNSPDKEKALHELIGMISHTQQHLDYINDEVVKNTFEIKKLIAHMSFVEHNLLETRKMLEFIVSGMRPKNDRFAFKSSQLPTIVTKKTKDISNANEDRKKFALHDNTAIRCKNCKTIGSITEENCKECGAKI